MDFKVYTSDYCNLPGPFLTYILGGPCPPPVSQLPPPTFGPSYKILVKTELFFSQKGLFFSQKGLFFCKNDNFFVKNDYFLVKNEIQHFLKFGPHH